MPRDSRQFITLPLDFADHPKVAPLSDAAFRTFIELNIYSRQHELDGVIPVKTARARWKAKALAELVDTHTDRPMVILDDQNYVLRNYDEHQITKAEMDEIRLKRAESGAAGGRATASKRVAKVQQVLQQTGGKPLASAVAKVQQTGSKPLADLRLQTLDVRTTDITYDVKSSHLLNSDPPGLDSDEVISLDFAREAYKRAARFGMTNLPAVREWFEDVLERQLDLDETLDIASTILSKAAGEVHNVDGYLRRVTLDDPIAVKSAALEKVGGSL